MYFSGALCLWPWLCLVTQAIGRARIPTRSQPELDSQQPELDWHQPELDSQPNESKSFRVEPSHQSRSALQPQSWPNYRPQIRLGATEGKIFWKFGAHFDKKVQRNLKFGSFRQNFGSGVKSALQYSKIHAPWILFTAPQLQFKVSSFLKPICYTVGARIPNMFGFWMVDGVRFMVPTIQKPHYG